MKNKITYYLFNVWVVLFIGIVGVILTGSNNDIVFAIALSCLGYLSLVVIVLTIVGIVNVIKNIINKSLQK